MRAEQPREMSTRRDAAWRWRAGNASSLKHSKHLSRVGLHFQDNAAVSSAVSSSSINNQVSRQATPARPVLASISRVRGVAPWQATPARGDAYMRSISNDRVASRCASSASRVPDGGADLEAELVARIRARCPANHSPVEALRASRELYEAVQSEGHLCLLLCRRSALTLYLFLQEATKHGR